MTQLRYFAVDDTDFDAAGFETGGIEIESELIQYDHDEDDLPISSSSHSLAPVATPASQPVLTSPAIRESTTTDADLKVPPPPRKPVVKATNKATGKGTRQKTATKAATKAANAGATRSRAKVTAPKSTVGKAAPGKASRARASKPGSGKAVAKSSIRKTGSAAAGARKAASSKAPVRKPAVRRTTAVKARKQR